MARNKAGEWRRMFLYGGSKDERNQGLYDRVGYYTGIFLFIGILADIMIKMGVFGQGLDQILSELVILALSGAMSVFLYIRFGIAVFENIRQKRVVRAFTFALGIGVLPMAFYIPLFLKLPAASALLDLGLIGYAIPLAVSAVGIVLILLVAQAVDFLAKKKIKDLEGTD